MAEFGVQLNRGRSRITDQRSIPDGVAADVFARIEFRKEAAQRHLRLMTGGVALANDRSAGGVIQGLISDVYFTFSDDSIFKHRTKPYGNRYTEFRTTNSKYGVPINQGSSSIRTGGNVIWMLDIEEQLQYRGISHTSDSPGSNTIFGDQTQEPIILDELVYSEYHYLATFAVAFVDTLEDLSGEIVRLWANGSIIWDVRDSNVNDPAQFCDNHTRRYVSQHHFKNTVVRVYNGTTDNVDQDPAMVEAEGIDNVPLYRGMSYAVIERLDLRHFGQKIPIIQAEISYDAIPTLPARTWTYEGTLPLGEAAWQHYSIDLHKAPTGENYWQDLDVFNAVAFQGPNTYLTYKTPAFFTPVPSNNNRFNLTFSLQGVDTINANSAQTLVAQTPQVDRWGNFLITMPSVLNAITEFNGPGVQSVHHATGIAPLVFRMFYKDLLSVDGNPPTNGIIFGGREDVGMLQMLYKTETNGPSYRCYSRLWARDYLVPFIVDTVNSAMGGVGFVFPVLDTNAFKNNGLTGLNLMFNTGPNDLLAGFGTLKANDSSFLYSLTEDFGEYMFSIGPSWGSFLPGGTNNVLVSSPFHSDLFKIPVSNPGTYSNWATNFASLTSIIDLPLADSNYEGTATVFLDSQGTYGKVIIISGGEQIDKFDIENLKNTPIDTLTPVNNIIDLAESQHLIVNDSLESSNHNYDQGLMLNRLMVRRAGNPIVWGFYDFALSKFVGPDHGAFAQIPGEAAVGPGPYVGDFCYYPAAHGFSVNGVFGLVEPILALFRYKNNWQTLDVVITRLIEPFIRYIDITDIDVSDLSSIVCKGYLVADVTDLFEYIRRLRDIYSFDVIEIDSKLVFLRRGLGTPAIQLEDILLSPPSVSARKDQQELAESAELKYAGYEIDLQQAAQVSRRPHSLAINNLSLTVPVTFDKDEAIQRLEILHNSSYVESLGHTIYVSRRYSYLTPGDIVSYTDSPRARIVRMEVNTDGSLLILAANEPLGLYTSSAVGNAGIPADTNYLASSSMVIRGIEIPYPIHSNSMFGEIYYFAFQRFTTSSTNLFSFTNSTDLVNFGETSGTNTIGRVLRSTYNNTLTSPVLQSGTYPQREGTFDYSVSLTFVHYSGVAPTSATEAEIFEGKNVFLIGNELVGIKTITNIINNTYEATGLLRGMFSTHNEIDKHVSGDYVVEFNNLPKLSYTSDKINKFSNVFAQTLVRTSDSAPSHFIKGVSFRPLDVADVKFSKSTNDIIISWDRKNRYEGRMLSGSDIPAGDTTYDVEVMDYRDNTVVRAFTGLTSETVTYTSAQQTTDFGKNEDNISIIIYQANTDYGYGYYKYASSRFKTSEYIRDFSLETVGAVTGFKELLYTGSVSPATIESTRSGNNVLQLYNIDTVNQLYYYFLDDIYSTSEANIDLVFRYDKFSNASGTVLRIVFTGVSDTIINYVDIDETSITYHLYCVETGNHVNEKTITIPQLKINTWYKFSGLYKDAVFNIKEILEPHKIREPNILINETHELVRKVLAPTSVSAGAIGLGNDNRNYKTQVKYIKVI